MYVATYSYLNEPYAQLSIQTPSTCRPDSLESVRYFNEVEKATYLKRD